MAKTGSKFKRIAGTVLLVCAVICAALVFVSAVLGRKRNSPAYVFGYAMMRVETGSMEPAIGAKSYILVKKYDGGELAEGDIVTYRMQDVSSAAYGSLITHRIEKITDDGYVMKGDANAAADAKTVKKEDIAATFKRNLPVFTFFGRLYASPFGLVALFAAFIAACAFVYVPEIAAALGEEKREEEKRKLMDERVREEVQKMLRENGAEHADRGSGSEKQVNDEEISDKTQK